MASEGVSGDDQTQLAALLRYFAHGDFARFSRAAELVFGQARSNEPYFCSDLLFAFQIAGFCEVTNASGVTHWWASHWEDIHVNSVRPKHIGVTSQWFSEHQGRIVALITDSMKSSLVLGSFCDNASAVCSVFNRAFVNLVPAFPEIEHQLCVEVPFRDELSGGVEVFDPSVGRWNEAVASRVVGPQLIRCKREYSGVDYYVQHSTFGVRIKVTQPEWAFIVAYHILPWRLSTILRVDGDCLRMNRAVRLPAVLYRTLFAACKAVRLGPVVIFEGVHAECIRGIVSYFDAVGERA
jgi:hypothetical protein